MSNTKYLGSTGVANQYLEFVKQGIQDSLAVKQALVGDSLMLGRVVEVAEIICEALRTKHKILLFGNGGSAADAQHIAAEFVGKYKRERRALPALTLTANTSSLTAIGNDYGFESVFSRQVEALGVSGDVAIGISTSGNSENVLHALRVAKANGMKTVGFTGRPEGRIGSSVDCCLSVPSHDTPRIQECHILLGHIVCEIVEQELLG